jgi:hypothetical protein
VAAGLTQPPVFLLVQDTSQILALGMQTALDHIIDASGVNVKNGRNPVLKFSSPIKWPNFYRILKSEFSARFFSYIHDIFLSGKRHLRVDLTTE